MKNEVKREGNMVRQGPWVYYTDSKSAFRNSRADLDPNKTTIDIIYDEAPFIYELLKADLIKQSKLSQKESKNE